MSTPAPIPGTTYTLRTGEAVTVLDAGQSMGDVKIVGPHKPPERWWTAWQWDIYALDAVVVTEASK